MSYSWDDEDTQTQYQKPKSPIWALKLDDPANEKEILKWLNGEVAWLEEESTGRIRRCLRNLALYKGIQYQSQEIKDANRDITDSRERVAKKVPVNHLFELTENRMSRLIKYKPAVAILPTNDEFSDKVSAKLTKSLLDHIWYQAKFEGELSPQVARDSMLMGESYLFPFWNPDKGDLSPAYKQAKENADKQGKKIPLLDDSGSQVIDPSGNPVYVSKPVRVGDVDYKIRLAMDVFPQRAECWNDVEYLFVKDTEQVEKLRVAYPDKARDIKPTGEAKIYDYEKMEVRSSKNEVVVYTFWHRRTDSLDDGRSIRFTKDTILESHPFPYSHRDLPCVRFTDIDVPGEIHSLSFFELIKGLVGVHNNLTNLIIRNQIMVSHPKWMLPAGSAKLDQLGNDITIVQFKGPQAPALVQANPTPSEVFKFREQLKNEFVQIAGVFPVSRGEVPPGIKAGVALQFLSEQESERFNQLVLKWNEFIRQVAIQTISICGDYYDASDDRMVRVVGKTHQWMSQFFDVAHLSKDYDVRVQNSSALPQSKAARIQTIMDLNQQFPGLLPQEQILEMLDLAQSEKFTDAITTAVRTAEAENEKLLEDSSQDAEQLAPEEGDDHIQHWKIHSRQLQEYGFKYLTPTEKKIHLEDHIRVHEMFMVEKAMKNPAFAQALSGLQLFPIFYVQESQFTGEPQVEQSIGSSSMEGLAIEPGLPVNPDLGTEPQLPVAESVPGLEKQMATEIVAPIPGGPIEPTGAI